jgi:quinolinate synthase
MVKTDKEILQEIADCIPKVRIIELYNSGRCFSEESKTLKRIIGILKEENIL